jgi:HAD superfamily hydrolase (TIGR01509 family)
MADCIAEIEAQLGSPLPAHFIPELRKRIADLFRDQLLPMPGAVELVRSLTIPCCVASSGPREKIELSLAITGLLPMFTDRIISSYEVNSWKPDPGLFLHAARMMGIPPEACAVVEDSPPGIQAGIAAGMQVFALCDSPNDLPDGVTAISCLLDLQRYLNHSSMK